MKVVKPVRTVLAGAVLWLLAGVVVANGSAGAAETAAVDTAAQADIARIENYLNGLTTLDSKFVQFSDQGVVEGRIRLSRPGRFRIEYEPPVPVLMVASGLFVMYHDRELQQTSYLPVSETPAAFLLKKRIDLSDGLDITHYERGPQSIRLTVVESDAPDAGSVTLTFEDQPLRLAKWRVIDAQGNQVDVALLEPKFGVNFDSDIFSTVDPLHGYPSNQFQ